MIASVVPSAPWSGQWRYDRTLYTMSCSRMLDHLQSEIVVRPDLCHWRMINLERLDLLDEIGGVSTDVDYIANAQRSTKFELHGHDREVAALP
jgi:hypothetical protein